MITNILGQTVLTVRFTSAVSEYLIDVTPLAAGIYYPKLFTDKGIVVNQFQKQPDSNYLLKHSFAVIVFSIKLLCLSEYRVMQPMFDNSVLPVEIYSILR